MKSTFAYMVAFAGLPLLAACASTGPSQELKSARDAYAKASSAAPNDPASTREAQQALDAAEAAHRDDAGSEQERALAYVAERKSEMAVAKAEEARAIEDREKADQAYQAELEQQLSATKRDLEAQQADSERAKKELVNWRKKGEDLVVTLSGVLFETGGHDLTADAKKRLDAVAHSVKQNPDRAITIAGYTDSKGTEEFNRTLSQQRADEVKGYLQTKGIPASRIISEGHGEDNAIASNDTAEGRAENRRVEITLHRAGEQLSERQPVKGTDPEPMPMSKPK